MPRSNWKGVISFGLVSIPVILYPVINKAVDISFHQIDRRNKARIKYQRINSVTGKEVPWEDITRGYEYDKDMTIPVPDDVLETVAGVNARTIDIQTFINKNELNFVAFDHFYYITPDEKGKGDKGYVILREALKEINKIGIARVIISTKEYVAAVIPQDEALILCLLRYAKEIRDLKDLNLPNKDLKHYQINKKEMDVAKQLIKSMSSKWKPEKYVDEYQKAIHKWVDEAAHDMPHARVKQSKRPATNVINFMDLLKKSLAEKNKKVAQKKPSPVKAKRRMKR